MEQFRSLLLQSQSSVSSWYTQPVEGLHESAVHFTPSFHRTAAPALHCHARQVSGDVQALPSLHGEPSGT